MATKTGIGLTLQAAENQLEYALAGRAV